MALSVENLHSAVNRKQGTQTLVSNKRNFTTNIKESIKTVTKWSIHYFTSWERWYPLPDSAVSLASLEFPKRTKNLSSKTINSDQKHEWASVNEAVVSQWSCRQETTMARAGTLPENTYFEEITPISSNQGTNTNEQWVDKELNEAEDDIEESEDEIWKWEWCWGYLWWRKWWRACGQCDKPSNVSCSYFLQVWEKYKTQ